MNKFLLKYNRTGPRYTSYPPATFFTGSYNNEQYVESLKQSNGEEPQAISIYVHIPFCPRQCHFCGCNTTIATSNNDVERYINAITKEIENVAANLDKKRKVTQIHWGGGTPNAIPFVFIEKIMDTIKHFFDVEASAEVAMECNPAYIEYEHIDLLKKFGFNRISLGIQDFNNETLSVINRLPSKNPIEELISYIKKNKFKGINIDLIYGLPKQTPESFTKTIKKAIELSPDRIVTFSYAHVPWFNPNMKILEKHGLPTTEEKFELFDLAFELLSKNGYIPIGLDHYAKPTDDLSIAMTEKKLHRNFQGYCTRETTGQVYAFGASGISQMWNSYSQNIKNYVKYCEEIETKGFAIERGYKLTIIDQICREAINAIMCNGYLNFKTLANQFTISVEKLKEILKFDPENLEEFIEDGLVEMNDEEVTVNADGMLIVRNIAMVIDPQLEVKQGMYSKTI